MPYAIARMGKIVMSDNSSVQSSAIIKFCSGEKEFNFGIPKMKSNRSYSMKLQEKILELTNPCFWTLRKFCLKEKLEFMKKSFKNSTVSFQSCNPV